MKLMNILCIYIRACKHVYVLAQEQFQLKRPRTARYFIILAMDPRPWNHSRASDSREAMAIDASNIVKHGFLDPNDPVAISLWLISISMDAFTVLFDGSPQQGASAWWALHFNGYSPSCSPRF